MKIFLLLLLLFVPGFEILAEESSNEAIMKQALAIKPGKYSIFSLVQKLRSTDIVDFEEGLSPMTAKIDISAQEVGVGQLLSKLVISSGYDYQIKNGVITIRAPEVEKQGLKYALDIVVEHVDFSDAPISDVFGGLSTKQNLPIIFTAFGKESDPKITLHLNHVTLRQILDELIKVARLRGWNSSISSVRDDNGYPIIAITVQ